MRFGVISTANIGKIAVIPSIQKTDNEVVAVGSRAEARAREAADEFSIDRYYGSYDEVLEDDGVEAIYNPLPNSMHAEWTKKAADKGLDVLCEKPLGVNAEEAMEMSEHCEEQGVTLMEAFMYRYHPRTRRAREVVEEEFNEVRFVRSSFQFPLRRSGDIRLDPELGGGSLMDVGCYSVNASRLFLGEPERVIGRTRDTRDCGVETQMAAILEYDGATAEVSSGFDTGRTEFYRVEATNGWLEARNSFVPGGETELEYEVDGRRVTETFDEVDQYKLEVEHFVECVNENRQPITDGKEAAKNMRVIDAIYESAEKDKVVEVDDGMG